MSTHRSDALPPDDDTQSDSHLDESLPYAYGQPSNGGKIKVRPDDFVVDEILGFPLTAEGEHSYLLIEKIGENSEHVARLLARFAGVPLLNVGYAGLKDRHARTRQWFSVGLAGKTEPDWPELDSPTMRVIETARHRRKLKRGDLAGNRFRITVRSVTGACETIEQRISLIACGGVPNYFGPQRFGRQGGNLGTARELLLGSLEVRSRHHRSLYLSAARAYLFNRILAMRVERGIWNRLLPGDALMAGPDDRPTQRWPAPDELAERMASLAIHPAGTLWGRGRSWSSGEALTLEHEALQDCEELCHGLARMGLERAMRPLRLAITEPTWCFTDASTLELRFVLPAGAYATSVLREVFVNEDS